MRLLIIMASVALSIFPLESRDDPHARLLRDDLILRAHAIVIVRVHSYERVESSTIDSSDLSATAVETVIPVKGRTPPEFTIEDGHASYIHPPPHYEPGERYLVFLTEHAGKSSTFMRRSGNFRILEDDRVYWYRDGNSAYTRLVARRLRTRWPNLRHNS